MKGIIVTLICAGAIVANIAVMPTRYALPVRIETLRQMPLPQIVRASGSVEPKRSLVIKAEFDGPVQAKHFKEGDSVKKGQLLLAIGRDRIRLEYENKANSLENAQADLVKAKKEAEVSRALFKKGAVARSTVEDADRALTRAKQTLKASEEDFKQQKIRWNKDKLYALFDGTVVKDSIGNEMYVSQNKEIATLADVSEYSIVARVDELEIRQVREGQPAEVRLQAYGERPIRASVSSIGSQAQGDGLPEIPVTLVLQNVMGMALRPNMTGVVRMVTGISAPTLSVPLSAISNATGQPRVWVVNASKRLESRTVTLGQSNPDRVEITQGLKEGEKICITADATLANGRKVRIDTSPLPLTTLGSSGKPVKPFSGTPFSTLFPGMKPPAGFKPSEGYKPPEGFKSLMGGTTGQRPPMSREEFEQRMEKIRQIREKYEAIKNKNGNTPPQ